MLNFPQSFSIYFFILCLFVIIYPTKKETHHYDFPIKISFL